MTALTLANMLTRLKYIVPTTTMDTECTAALVERMNYLATLDTFPFNEAYQSFTISASSYSVATPSNFAILKSIVIWDTSNNERELIVLDSVAFSEMFPKPDERTDDTPTYCCIKVTEREIWFDCAADGAYTGRIEFWAVPDDVTGETVSHLTELAKLTIINWAAANIFRQMSQYDNADRLELEGNRYLEAMKKRYQLALEKDARILSPQFRHAMRISD